MTDDCPRVMSKQEMLVGLLSGRTLCVDRRDAPELLDLIELERMGWLTSRLVEIDEQSSRLEFRWNKK